MTTAIKVSALIASYGPDIQLADSGEIGSIERAAGELHDSLREAVKLFRQRVKSIREDDLLSALGQNEQIGRAVYETLGAIKQHEASLFALSERLEGQREAARIKPEDVSPAIRVERRSWFKAKVDAGENATSLAIGAASEGDQTLIAALEEAPKWFSIIDEGTLAECRELLQTKMSPEVRSGLEKGKSNLDAANKVYQTLIRELRREGGFDPLKDAAVSGKVPDEIKVSS